MPPPKLRHCIKGQKWCVTAQDLNAFWNILYPRMMPWFWGNRRAWEGKSNHDARKILYNRLTAIIKAIWGKNRQPRDVRLVAQHFRDNVLDGPCKVPILFYLDGAFDFIITNEGLVLPVPPNPNDARYGRGDAPIRRIYQLYALRSTASPPLGAATDLRQSGGCSLVQNFSIGNNAIFGLRAAHLSHFPSIVVRKANITNMPEDLIDILVNHELIPNPDSPSSSIRIGLECFMWIFQKRRDIKWQVSGSVFRKIMREFPKIIAQIWYDESLVDEFKNTAYPTPTSVPNRVQIALPDLQSYRTRYNNPAAQYGLRSIFEERMEIVLPGDLLRFEVGRKSEEDVCVCKEGFFFPELPSTPSITELYRDWTLGNAGNPVFTDTAHTG